MFKLLRYYALTSLVAIVSAAVLLAWFYRLVAIDAIVRVVERNNVELARVAMNTMQPELLAFLDSVAEVPAGSAVPAPSPALARHIDALLRADHSVAKIKLYNLRGTVAFSTKRDEIGSDQSGNKGVLAASAGGVASDLVYRDTFNSFDAMTEEDNLVQTYLPIRGPGETIRGVFELYGDVNALTRQIESMEFAVIGGAMLILLTLYAVLLLLVRRANRIIEQQQQTIRERNEALGVMAARMLRAEESQKKQVALELREGVAQTLTAAKLRAEGGGSARPEGSPQDAIVPMLQEAIREVRTIATELRPSSLDDLGLLATIETVRSRFEQAHPGVAIEQVTLLRESDIPPALKGILHRIIVSVLDGFAADAQARVRITLSREAGTLVLGLEGLPSGAPATGAERVKVHTEELATLSGGTFRLRRGADATLELRAAWPLQLQ